MKGLTVAAIGIFILMVLIGFFAQQYQFIATLSGLVFAIYMLKKIFVDEYNDLDKDK